MSSLAGDEPSHGGFKATTQPVPERAEPFVANHLHGPGTVTAGQELGQEDRTGLSPMVAGARRCVDSRSLASPHGSAHVQCVGDQKNMLEIVFLDDRSASEQIGVRVDGTLFQQQIVRTDAQVDEACLHDRGFTDATGARVDCSA